MRAIAFLTAFSVLLSASVEAQPLPDLGGSADALLSPQTECAQVRDESQAAAR